MKDILIAFAFGVLLTGIPFSYLAIRSSSQKQSKVLAEKVISTPTPSPSARPTPKPTPRSTPTPKPPTPIPTPTAIPQPIFSSQQINGFIDRFAGQYAVNPNVLRHIAVCESGFDPLVENSGYAGLFQFGPTTWANIRKEIGEDISPDLRFNAEEAVQTAAYALSQGKKGIWPNCIP